MKQEGFNNVELFEDDEPEAKTSNYPVLNSMSTQEQVAAYFEEVKRRSKSKEQYPVNLDEVWPLIYHHKRDAVRFLKESGLFMEGIDYQASRRKAQAGPGTTTTIDYYITIQCMEFLVARRNRLVFEVYRRFFHQNTDDVVAALPNSMKSGIARTWGTIPTDAESLGTLLIKAGHRYLDMKKKVDDANQRLYEWKKSMDFLFMFQDHDLLTIEEAARTFESLCLKITARNLRRYLMDINMLTRQKTGPYIPTLIAERKGYITVRSIPRKFKGGFVRRFRTIFLTPRGMAIIAILAKKDKDAFRGYGEILESVPDDYLFD